MKKICVNQSHFNKVVGFTLWILATSGILFIFIATSIELESNYLQKRDFPLVDKWCYISVIDQIEQCRYNDRVVNRYITSLLLLIIDGLILVFYIYYKQQRVKFGWCETTGIKDDND